MRYIEKMKRLSPQTISSRVRESWIKSNYGITTAQFEKMKMDQGGVCAICGGKNVGGRRLGIDHCHKTGKVRALLCNHCNNGLGSFKDKIDLMAKAMKYLRMHQGRYPIAPVAAP